jgi:hypothetical protein
MFLDSIREKQEEEERQRKEKDGEEIRQFKECAIICLSSNSIQFYPEPLQHEAVPSTTQLQLPLIQHRNQLYLLSHQRRGETKNR